MKPAGTCLPPYLLKAGKCGQSHLCFLTRRALSRYVDGDDPPPERTGKTAGIQLSVIMEACPTQQRYQRGAYEINELKVEGGKAVMSGPKDHVMVAKCLLFFPVISVRQKRKKLN